MAGVPGSAGRRRDSAVAAYVACVAMRPCEFGMPSVYKPSEMIRVLKNTIQAIRAKDGVTLSSTKRSRLFKGTGSVCGILGAYRLCVPCRCGERPPVSEPPAHEATSPENCAS